jgi:hypothetical protein
MLGLLLLAGAAGAAWAAYRCRPGTALLIAFACLTLVPGTLPVPGMPGAVTVQRLVLLAAGLGLARRCYRGELPWRVFALPPIALRLLLLVGVLAIVGVGLLESSTDVHAAARAWQGYAAQVMVLVVAVALLRADGRPRRAAIGLAVAVTVAAGIAVLEHLTGQSYARAWFRAVPSLLETDQAQVLAERGGQVRVRAAGDFTLAYAWATAACVPVVLALGVLSRGVRRVALLSAVPLLLLAVVWTFSRSVIAPTLVAVLIVLSRVRGEAVRWGAAAMLTLGGLIVLTNTALQRNFTASVDQGSIDVRVDRLPAVLSLAADHPYKGLGLTGLEPFGFPGTDSSFLLTYAETGVIGLAVLIGVLLAAVGAAGRGARQADPDVRLLGLALGTGAALLVLGGAVSFDAFTTASVAALFWVLVAIGVVLAEQGSAPAPRPDLGRRLVAIGALCAIGFGARAAAPTNASQTWQFDTLDPYSSVVFAPTYTGVQLRVTLCELLAAELPEPPRTCQPIGNADREGQAPGLGLLRLQAADLPSLRADAEQAEQIAHRVRQLTHLRLVPVEPEQVAAPNGLRTAPVWLPLLGSVLLAPLGRRRA